MKQFVRIILASFFLSVFLLPCTVYAIGEGNLDNGGGSMGQGSSSNKWTPGHEGVRVSIVRASDHSVVCTPIDLTNRNPVDIRGHFGKVSKLSYTGGRALTPSISTYTYINPEQALPKIISSQSLGKASIEEIKSYFTDEQVIRGIARETGMNFDVLVNGDYKLLIEPVSYVTFEDTRVAMTATEAALYDERMSGLVRANLPTVGFQSLPLAMFLEVGDLGYPAWTGPTTGVRSNHEIKTALGLGIVRFHESKPEEPVVKTYDYEYRVNTEVITSVRVSGGQSDPDHPVSVTFNISGTNYRVANVFYPAGDDQLAWIRWTTPGTPQTMTIKVFVSGGGSAQGTVNVKIVDLNENPPPNPVADDRNDSFSLESVPNREAKQSASWSIWRPWWHAYWVWISDDDDGGWWEDRGWWEFDLDQYRASLSSSMSIKCDDRNPTNSGTVMKSGYGINQTVTGSVSSNQSGAVTQPQNAVSYFPEFAYQTYWRLLERIGSGQFEFQKNQYSTYQNRTHFSPIWMPDGSYTVNTWLIDAWTPDGMLCANLTDSLTIRGNLWQDWHVGPLKP